MTTQRNDDVRKRAQRILQGANVLIEGHFDFGNGYHGRTYLNPHMLFCQPSTIWQLAQDLLDVLPYEITTQVQAVVGPATGGALLAHTLAGLLDGRRSLEHPPCMFAPVDYDVEEGLRLRSTYRAVLAGKKVLIADDVRNTGKTLEPLRRAGAEGRWRGDRDDADLRSDGKRRHARRPQRAAARVRRARHLHVDDLPAVCSGGPVDLLLMPSLLRLRADDLARLRGELDRLHDSYNVPDSTADPVQFVWRYDDPRDREVVAAIASGLAFGRLASVLASVERVLALLGPHPAAYLEALDVRAAREALAEVVHRWTRGDDLVALLVVLRDLRARHGSLEGAFLAGDDPASADVSPGLEAFCAAACAVDVREAYGGARRGRLGVQYFFPRPSLGSACKRLNLFARWMVRQDAVDPGGWTRRVAVAPRHPARHPHHPRRSLPAAHPLHQSRLADGRRHHGDAASRRSRRPRALRLLALPHEHDGRVRLGAEGRQRAVSAARVLPAGQGRRAQRRPTPRRQRPALAPRRRSQRQACRQYRQPATVVKSDGYVSCAALYSSRSSSDFGQSSRSRRDSARSASNLPPVWQVGQ